jgi:hypothetical protein
MIAAAQALVCKREFLVFMAVFVVGFFDGFDGVCLC